MRNRDAPYNVFQLESFANTGDLMMLKTNKLRYASMNYQSLFKFGSVEFRALRTKPELDNIVDWCKIFRNIEQYSDNIETPWNNIVDISGFGPEQWAKKVLGEEYFNLVKYPGMEEDIMEDVREIQMFSNLIS